LDEHRVGAIGGEQLTLIVGVHVLDSAHDQPGVDVFGLGLGREREVVDLGDLSVADPPLLIVVEDCVGVLDRCPGFLVDAGDGLADGLVLAGGDREAGVLSQGGDDHVVAVVGRVRPQHQCSGRASLPGRD